MKPEKEARTSKYIYNARKLMHVCLFFFNYVFSYFHVHSNKRLEKLLF